MKDRWVLQFCHSHYGPFLDVARQYAVLFKDTPLKVLTVYLTGSETEQARHGSASDEVIFMENSKSSVRGLKLGVIQAVRKIVASRNIELIIAHRFKPLYIACLASKVPVIAVHHAYGDYERLSRRLFVRCFRERLILLGVSNAVRDDIRRCLRGWPSDRILTLYNRIDIPALQSEQVSREAARDFLKLPQNAYVIGNVGRLHSDKDQATLINGFALASEKLPQPSLLAIMGEGKLENELRKLSIERGVADKVLFLGQVPLGRKYFRAFDIFALTSNHEPFGMVLLEAMAAGVPVMGTNCGGAAEVIGNAEMLFELRNATELSEKIINFVSKSPASTEQQTMETLERLSILFSDVSARSAFFKIPIASRSVGNI